MIAAKIQCFREQIRRRQIDDKFKRTRESMLKNHLPRDISAETQNYID